MLDTLQNIFLQLLYPAHCPGCGQTVPRQGQWCPMCWQRVWHPRKLNHSQAIRFLDGCYCLVDYRGAVRHVLHDLKYKKAKRQAAACQSFLWQFPWMTRLQQIDTVVPVPLALEKMQERGFNQTELIFRSWAETHWQWADGLQRVRCTAAQWQLSRNERSSNVKRAFEVKGSFSARKKHILLVDDIYTTGMTMESCAKALKEKGAASVTGLVIASSAL